jgi:hypothetical protein
MDLVAPTTDARPLSQLSDGPNLGIAKNWA